MLRMTVYAILLIVITSKAHALMEARLLNQSSSGQTVMFNLGTLDGITSGDYAVIVKQIRSLDNRDLRMIPVARAKNVKANSDSSVWILYKTFDPELMIKGDKFMILSETHMLSGRKSPKFGRITVVSPKKDVVNDARNVENSDKDRLSKLKNNYNKITDAHETTEERDADVDLIDLEVWKKNKDVRYRSSIYKSADKAEFRRQLRLATFEKMVAAYLERVNDPDFNYDSFYAKQRKSAFSNEINANGNPDNEYNHFLRNQSKKATADARLFRTILEKGQSWSQEYSDEELRDILNNVSVLQEKERKIWVVAKPTRFSANLDYGFNLNNSQTDKDPLYQRDKMYATQLDFEVTPFLKHPVLERFTVNTAFRMNYTAFEANNYNVGLDEYSFSLGANWYPLNTPYATEAPILFLGTYVRTGIAKATAPTVNESSDYTVMSLPGFRGGFKYILRNHIGIRLLLSMETLKIERYKAALANSNLPSRSNLVEAKMGVGLAYAF